MASSKASLAASLHLAAVALGEPRRRWLGSREYVVKGAGDDRSLGLGRGGGTPRGGIGGALDIGGGLLLGRTAGGGTRGGPETA